MNSGSHQILTIFSKNLEFLLKFILIPLVAMFGLWYFSLALDEIRKRFSLLDRIITFFTGKAVSNQQPAIESENSESTQPAEVDDSSKPEPVVPPKDTPASPKVTPEPPPKPVEKPIVKPAPEAPAVKPVEPTKPKDEVPPAVEVKPEAKEQPKPDSVPEVAPVPAPEPVKPQEPTTNGQPKVTEPVKPAPPTPAAVPAKVSEDDSLRSLLPAASAVVELPSSNEDSFIIVENQKPKPTTTTTTTTNVKNSTLDFLRAEGGRGAAAAPAMPSVATANKPDQAGSFP